MRLSMRICFNQSDELVRYSFTDITGHSNRERLFHRPYTQLFASGRLIIGIILAGRFYPTVAEWLSFISSPEWANIIAFLLILMTIWVATTLIAKLLDTMIKPTFLNWVNRLGGAIFGLLVSGIFTAALLAIWVKFFDSGSVITDSAVAQILLDKFPLILSLLPDEFGVIQDFFN
ncbi:cvpA family protein [Dehalococcoides mccartyi]|uniref:CvpA family protein n=1 Tax=Dehalococcoides mccartyi TaxID=61435 RepID=A0A328EMJ8_9CHLR|nr:cvpA family protein [Dehalococcoides mccartyi]